MDERLSSEQRRKEILEAALEIMFERGFYELTIRNLADNVGLSEGAIYRHFKNKKEIVDKLTDLACGKLEDTRPDQDLPASQQLMELMHHQFRRLEDNPYLSAVTFQEEIFRQYPGVKEKFDEHRKRREDAIVSIVEKGQKEGEFSENIDPEIFALIFMGSVRMSVFQWRHEDFSYSLAKKSRKIHAELTKMLED